jgi:hypothetical protein
MFTSSLIQKAYQLTANSDTRNKHRYAEEVNKLLIFNKTNKGADLLNPLNFYLGILENTESALIPFMTETQKNQIVRDLQVTYLLLLAEKKYEFEHQKIENSRQYNDYLNKCQRLIDTIFYKKHCEQQLIKPAPEKGYLSDEKPVAYLGLAAGHLFADEMVEVASGSTTKTILANIGHVNAKRLYWVWASSFLKTILSLLPPNFFFGDQAKEVMKIPDPYTGTMSWGLYYFRFSLNLGLLLKHTISGPWMSKEEQSESWTERFKTQWAQRKFVLLNDLFWATGNLVCFFWLCGKGTAGTWGDMLTIALLVFDIGLAAWEFEEKRTQYNQQINDYEEAIHQLKEQNATLISEQKKNDEDMQRQLGKLHIELEALDEQAQLKVKKQITTLVEQQKIEIDKKRAELIELNLHLSALERAKNKCAREWNVEKIHLATNVTYAVGLMLSFVLLAAPFMPLAAATLAAMTVSGAVLCFTISIIYNGIKSGIEIHKTRMTTKELKAEYAQKIAAFKELNAIDADDNAKKIMFLEIKKLSLENEYQEKLLTLQTMQLIRTILVESMIPPLVFISLVFLPLGPGLGVLAAAIGLAIATHLLINHLFKSEKEELKEFNEPEYEDFCANPDSWNKTPANSIGLFHHKEKNTFQETVDLKMDEKDNIPLLGKGCNGG